MPGRFLDYYTRVADRMIPYLHGRRAAIEQRFRGGENITFRRHTGAAGEDTWIRINDADDVLRWVRQYAEGFHAHIRSEGRGAWFVIDIDSRRLPTEMARLAAIHAADVLSAVGLQPLVKFSGSDGYHLMWDVPDLGKTDDAQLWELQREVVRSVACEVERKLAADPRAVPIREAVGENKPAITTGSADRENPDAILFDQFILKDNANFRVPFSVHPKTGLVAVPIPIESLGAFNPVDATPEVVAMGWPEVLLPRHTLVDVRKALDVWHADGC